MAQPSTEITNFRREVTALADQLAKVQHRAQIIGDLGGQAFIAPYLVGPNGDATTDVTLAEFLAGFAALSTLLGSLTAEQRAAIGVLRI
jgi:hypothetical protein